MITRTFAAICLATASLTAQSATLPVPSVDYSADRVMESEAGTFTGKVFFSAGNERTEMTAGSMQTVTILRPDRQLAYRLMPAQRMYMQMSVAAARPQLGATGAESVDITRVGAENIEGVPATKYKLLMKDGAGGGFMWFTAQGIAIKMDLLGTEGRKKTRTVITLKNLVVGPQDPQVFEVPADFHAMPSVGVGAAAAAPSDRGGTEVPPSAARSLLSRLPNLIK